MFFKNLNKIKEDNEGSLEAKGTHTRDSSPEVVEIGFCETCCNSETAKRSLKYYLENTTLHGLQYVADDQITIMERYVLHISSSKLHAFTQFTQFNQVLNTYGNRVYFGLAFISVVILSGWFISNIYVKWTASPIIIATSHKLTPTTEIPFPAITICNLNQALRSKVEDIPK